MMSSVRKDGLLQSTHVLSFQLFREEASDYYYYWYSSCKFCPDHHVHRKSYEAEEENEEDTSVLYVNPMVKKSCTKLSKRSLEMCTESIGSESGSENDMSLLTLLESHDSGRLSNLRCSRVQKKLKERDSNNFPPPLTSISGVRVESYREDGRLVLRAVVSAASRSSYFQFHAERSQGRLKLQLLKNVAAQEDEEEGNWAGVEMDHFGTPRSCSTTRYRRHTQELLNRPESFYVNFRLKNILFNTSNYCPISLF